MGNFYAFVIHSGIDLHTVQTEIDGITRNIPGFNAVVLNGDKSKKRTNKYFWKSDAARCIRSAQIVLFFVGNNSSLSPYIGWELKTAIRYKKRIISILLDKNNAIHPALYAQDKVSKTLRVYGEIKTIEDTETIINDYQNCNYHLFNNTQMSNRENLLFEQYKLFLETSETLVERRQSVNNFYISVNSGLLALSSLFAGIVQTSSTKQIILFVMAMVGIILCISWRQILESYGNLNSSKMKILSLLEKNLPASLFDAEWEVLSDKLNNKKYMSFTSSEKRIPMIFITLYVMICCSLLIFYLLAD